MRQKSRLTNEVITHTHHHPGPGRNAHKEAECRAAVSNRFGFKWRCLTAGGVHVADIQRRPLRSEAKKRPSGGGPFGPEQTAITGYMTMFQGDDRHEVDTLALEISASESGT